LSRADPLVLEGRVFQRFVARNLAAGSRPAVSLAEGLKRTYDWIGEVAG